MTAFVPDLLIKLTLLLAAGLAIASLVRGAAASLRHLVLFATLASALALPMVMLLAPRWEVPVLPNTAGVSATHYAPSRSVIEPAGSDLGLESSTQTSGLAQSVSGLSTGDATTRAAGNLAVVNTPWIARVVPALPVVWLLGCVAVFGWLIIGRVRLARIGRSAWPLESVDWQRVLKEERRAAEVTKSVRLCSSPVVSTPLTWGLSCCSPRMPKIGRMSTAGWCCDTSLRTSPAGIRSLSSSPASAARSTGFILWCGRLSVDFARNASVPAMTG